MSAEIEYKAERIREFLADSVVQEAFTALETASLIAFKSAKTDDERRDAQAMAKAGDRLIVELARTVDAGERARIERERHERAPDTRHSAE